MSYKTIIIEESVHKKLKDFCRKNNLKINEYVNLLIEDNIDGEQKSLLPMVLRNNKGEIVENISCTYISKEYKNSMPKDITLMRNTNEGSGFIGNYSLK